MPKKGTTKYENYFKLGQVFGDWEIIDTKIYIEKEACVLTRCKCGTQKKTPAYQLVKGISKRCEHCGNHNLLEKNHNWKGYKEIPKSWIARFAIKQRTSSRFKFEVTIEDVYNLWIKQDKKCALSNVPINFSVNSIDGTASLDRIDSLLPYTLTNIQLVHKTVNIMKNRFNQEEFILFCKKIAEHNN